MYTPPGFPAISTKNNNLSDFLLASRNKALQKRGTTFKGANLLLEEPIRF